MSDRTSDVADMVDRLLNQAYDSVVQATSLLDAVPVKCATEKDDVPVVKSNDSAAAAADSIEYLGSVNKKDVGCSQETQKLTTVSVASPATRTVDRAKQKRKAYQKRPSDRQLCPLTGKKSARNAPAMALHLEKHHDKLRTLKLGVRCDCAKLTKLLVCRGTIVAHYESCGQHMRFESTD